MSPEQLPGTLFVVLLALAAFLNKDPDVIFLLAIACAAGWFSYSGIPAAIYLWWACIALNAVAALTLATRIFL